MATLTAGEIGLPGGRIHRRLGEHQLGGGAGSSGSRKRDRRKAGEHGVDVIRAGALVPNVQLVCAKPVGLVVTFCGLTEPLPRAASQVIALPPTPFPLSSTRRTTSGSAESRRPVRSGRRPR